jgi:hypothetical protein
MLTLQTSFKPLLLKGKGVKSVVEVTVNSKEENHRLNMELELQSLYGLHVHSCTHWLKPLDSPPPNSHLGLFTRALMVSQDRRHLFVTP